MAQEEEKVTVYLTTDPTKTRQVTRVAAGYLNPKWKISEDQPVQEKKVERAAAPAVAVDRRPELQAKYKEISGQDADPDWNQARLHVEIVKAEAGKAKTPKVEPEQTLTPGAENVEAGEAVAAPTTGKRKYTKKDKSA